MNPPSFPSLVPGLVSVTFRKLSAEEILALCVRHGLRGIEWGGDVHCPPKDLEAARKVAEATRAAGVECAAYGSYYRAGESHPADFAAGLEVAKILGAPLIRVWAGSRGSAEAGEKYRNHVTEDLQRIAGAASAARKVVSLEYHAGTLTDTLESTESLLRSEPKLMVHWQPVLGQPPSDGVQALQRLLPRLSNLHVFAWDQSRAGTTRLPLASHGARWEQYFRVAASRPERRFALLEFVREDDPARLAGEARALRALLGWNNQSPVSP